MLRDCRVPIVGLECFCSEQVTHLEARIQTLLSLEQFVIVYFKNKIKSVEIGAADSHL